MKIFNFDKLLDTLTNYLETRLELFKLEVKEELSIIVARWSVYALIGVLCIIAFLCILGVLGAWLNELLQSTYLGYLIDLGIVSLMIFSVYSFRKRLERIIISKIEKAGSSDKLDDE